MRYRIDMSYDGAAFCGWQLQPSDPTVQEAVERALATLLKERVGVTGSGRTDTGVNASYYVAHFDFDGPVDCAQLRYKMNAILPKGVAVSSVIPVSDDFHARFGATMRQYTYYLHRVKDPFLERYSYFYGYPEVDFEAMNRAARALLGTHDFSCFEKSGGDNKTSVCTVFTARWEPWDPQISAVSLSADGSLSPAPHKIGEKGVWRETAASGEQHYWRFVIEADRFLRNMVRAIVGTLLEVGRGRRSEDDFSALILPADSVKRAESLRSAAGESVPGNALFLSDIRY